MSYCHHHIERSQEENKVEVGIAVHCALLLIVNHSLASPLLNMLFSISCKRQETRKFCKCNENWKQQLASQRTQQNIYGCALWLTQSNTWTLSQSQGMGLNPESNTGLTEILPCNSFLIDWVDFEHWEHTNFSTSPIFSWQVQKLIILIVPGLQTGHFLSYLTPELQSLQSCWA